MNDNSYRVFLMAEDGIRTPVEARSIVVELAPNQELELDLAPHPNHQGSLPILTGTAITNRGEDKLKNTHSRLVVRPGAANIIHVSIESN